MTPSRPYLLRALYDWIVDNQMTPYILVNAYGEGVLVPQEYVEGGNIILNVAPKNVRDLKLENHLVTFTARFGGIFKDIVVPVQFIQAIYAKENGRGMEFMPESDDDTPPEPPPRPPKRQDKPNLRLVEDED